MKKKKGFTLIELLAVIVVLAIIALIAVPLVTSQVEKSRQSAFKNSVIEASRGLTLYLNENQISITPGVDYGIDITELKNKKYIISNLISGKFVEIDGKINSYYITDGRYCAYGTIDNLEIDKDCSKLNPSTPKLENDAFNLSSTTNTITVTVDENKIIADKDIKNITYTLNLYLGKKLISTISQKQNQNTYMFKNLKKETEYTVELVAINSNLKQSKQSKNISTKNMNKPEFEINPNGYSYEKNVIIKYDSKGISNPKYYFKVLTNEKNITLEGKIKKCSDSKLNIYRPEPSSCSISTNQIENNVWYQTDNQIQQILLKENAVIRANTYDGNNYVDNNSTMTITTIDPTTPTDVDFSYKKTGNSITLIASGEDNESGIYGYQFYLEDNGWTEVITENTYTFKPVLQNHTYKAKVRVINNTYKTANTLNKKSYTESEEKSITTDVIKKPECKISPEGWATSKTASCTFPEGDFKKQYLRFFTEGDIPSLSNENIWSTYTEDLKFNSENAESLIVRVTDGLNIVQSENTYNITQIDTTAPTCVWNGESTSWRKSAIIALRCDDKRSGCTTSSTNDWKYETSGITKQTENLSYTISDKVGNKVTCSKTANVFVDSEAPSLNIKGYEYKNSDGTRGSLKFEKSSGGGISSGSEISGWKNYGYYLDFDVNDSNGSGIKNWKWEWNGSGSATLSTNIIGNSSKAMEANTNRTTFTHTVTGSGARYLVITITDNTGNITKYPIKMYIDRNAPATPTISAVLKNTTTSYTGKWTNKEVTITGTSSDELSKVTEIQYSYDKSSWGKWGTLSYSGNNASVVSTWGADRNTTLYARAKDNAGNYSDISSMPLRIDRTAPTKPTISAKVGNSNYTSGSITTGPVVLTASSTDAGSKIQKIQYSYDNSTWRENWGNNLTISGNTSSIKGTWSGNYDTLVYVLAIDNAGNFSEKSTIKLKISPFTYKTDNTGGVRNYCGTGWCTNLKQGAVNTKCTGTVHIQAYYKGAVKYQIQDNSTQACRNNPTVANCCTSSPEDMKTASNTGCTAPWKEGNITIGQTTFNGTKDAYKCIRACFDNNCSNNSGWTVVHVQNSV